MTPHQDGRRMSVDVSDDDDLLRRVRSPDEGVASLAFEEVYTRDYAVVWKFAYRFVGSRDLAQDLTQDVFVSVWERRRSLVVQGSLRTYLLAAVRLRAIDTVRREITERRAEGRLWEAGAVGGASAGVVSPDDAASLAVMETRIRQALLDLPERQRSALLLRWEQGLSNREIAQVLEIGEAAVSRLLTRAAEALRGFV